MSWNGSRRAWLVRGGREGEEREEFAVENGVCLINWDWLPDLSRVVSARAVRRLLSVNEDYADSRAGNLTKHANEIFSFVTALEVGDTVVLPFRKQPGRLAIGEVTGNYEYTPDMEGGVRHVRRVSWTEPTCLRASLPENVRRALAFRGTVHELPNSF